MSSAPIYVSIVEVRCRTHGPKDGLFYKGRLFPFPLTIEYVRVMGAKPLCFECRGVCTVIMEAVPEMEA